MDNEYEYNPYKPNTKTEQQVSELSKSVEQINTEQQEQITPEKVQKCPKCGELSSGKFCGNCGEDLQGKICKKCGKRTKTRFCENCGFDTELQEVNHKKLESKKVVKPNYLLSYALGTLIGIVLIGVVFIGLYKNQVVDLSSINLELGNKYTRQTDDNGIISITSKSGIIVDDAVWIVTPNMNDFGFHTGVYIENNTGKEIKYISTVSSCYNRVGDPAYLDYSISNEIKTRFTGPFEDEHADYFFSNKADGDGIEYMVLDKVIIEYMDGSTETISNIDIEHRFVSQYGDESEQKKYQ